MAKLLIPQIQLISSPRVLASSPHASVRSLPLGRLSAWLLVSGLLLTGFGGAFLPWIWRDSVALQLTGPGLAEFIKFLPEVRYGQVQLQRLFFLLPLFLAMLILPLVVENKKLMLPRWLRGALRLAIIPLALAALSPVWTPAVLMAPEFRLQTVLALMAIGFTVIAPILNRLSLWGLMILLLGSGMAAIILPIWQFDLIQASMIEAYHEPVSLGWGWWLTVTGIVLSIAGGIGLIFSRLRCSDRMSQPGSWTAFYDATRGGQPFQTLVKAMTFFAAEKGEATEYFAVDLGCGAGRDTFALLAEGWQVLAIDQQPEAIERIQAGVTPEQKARLQTQVAAFEKVVLPPADLVNASFSLPFCSPQHFTTFWGKIVASIRPGGRFAGQFFGEHDDWAGEPNMTFHTIEQIQQLLNGFEQEFFKEVDEEGNTAVGGSKHWHVFSIVARKLE